MAVSKEILDLIPGQLERETTTLLCVQVHLLLQ